MTGPSTDADVLEQLAPMHPLPAKIVEYRQFAKLKNTYVDALPTMIHPRTGRVHASFNQVVAATGRPFGQEAGKFDLMFDYQVFSVSNISVHPGAFLHFSPVLEGHRFDIVLGVEVGRSDQRLLERDLTT
jgi:hypothetical protein